MNIVKWPGHIVEADWLKNHLGSPNLRTFDATWFLPKAERSGRDEFIQQRIPGSVFFDYDKTFHREGSPFPRTMPETKVFEERLQDLGLNQRDRIVVYDNNGMFSSPRAWWMLRAIGVQEVGVLNGGLEAWKRAGGEISQGKAAAVQKGNFTAEPLKNSFVSSTDVMAALGTKTNTILDARSRERFEAAHMPGSLNLPYTDLIEDGYIRDTHALTEYFDDRPLICSCGSGVTACILALGATVTGHQQVSVYDASWSEWGSNSDLPKEGKEI